MPDVDYESTKDSIIRFDVRERGAGLPQIQCGAHRERVGNGNEDGQTSGFSDHGGSLNAVFHGAFIAVAFKPGRPVQLTADPIDQLHRFTKCDLSRMLFLNEKCDSKVTSEIINKIHSRYGRPVVRIRL